MTGRTYQVVSQDPQTVLTLAEAKAFLKVDGSTEDQLVQDILEGAVSQAERRLNYSLTQKTIKEVVRIPEDYPLDFVTLAWGPVSSLVSVKEYGTAINISVQFSFEPESKVGLLLAKNPPFQATAYQVEYQVTPHLVAPSVKNAIKRLVAGLYDFRTDPAQAQPSASEYLLDLERIDLIR